jgi:predicted transcriptional regulator
VSVLADRKSVTTDYLISLEDGKRYKLLRRHLTRLVLTPEQYREKWRLPSDYPRQTDPSRERRVFHFGVKL